MNKTLNTWLFMGLALVVNLVFMVLYFLLLTALGGLLVPFRPDWLSHLLWVGFFAASVFGAYLSYRVLFKIVKKKISLEKYFDPHFLKSRWF